MLAIMWRILLKRAIKNDLSGAFEGIRRKKPQFWLISTLVFDHNPGEHRQMIGEFSLENLSLLNASGRSREDPVDRFDGFVAV